MSCTLVSALLVNSAMNIFLKSQGQTLQGENRVRPEVQGSKKILRGPICPPSRTKAVLCPKGNIALTFFD
jgi:hypothetical protein